MANKWLYDDLTAIELFELAAEHDDVAVLITAWLLSNDDADRAAIFIELMQLSEELICEVKLDFEV